MAFNPIDLACRQMQVSQAELARRLGVSAGRVSQWKARGQVSPKHVMQVVQLTGLPANLFNPFFPPTDGSSPSPQRARK